MSFAIVISNYVCTTGVVHDGAIVGVDLVRPSSL